MNKIDSIKERLIDELWMPVVENGGSIFYPRQRNKKMKLFTLTSPSNFREVTAIMNSKLTRKDLITGWNYKSANRWSLEAEGKMDIVLGSTRYEDSIISCVHEIRKRFPFDIVNLDFSSQNPELEINRLEREILGVEHTVKLQVEKKNRGMVLIYTTLLNSNQLHLERIKQNSDRIKIQGWNGLSIDRLPSTAADCCKKTKCLEETLQQICFKYQYETIGDPHHICIKLPNQLEHILSTVTISKGVV